MRISHWSSDVCSSDLSQTADGASATVSQDSSSYAPTSNDPTTDSSVIQSGDSDATVSQTGEGNASDVDQSGALSSANVTQLNGNRPAPGAANRLNQATIDQDADDADATIDQTGEGDSSTIFQSVPANKATAKPPQLREDTTSTINQKGATNNATI